MENNFINEEYLKELTIIQQNVNANLLTPFISTSQDLDLKPILGYKLYQDILDKFLNDTLSDEENILLGYIKPFLAFQTFYHYTGLAYTKFTNKGMEIKTNDNSESVDLDGIKYLRNQINSWVEGYKRELINFLEDNKKYFTLYNQKDVKKTSNKNIIGGMYFG